MGQASADGRFPEFPVPQSCSRPNRFQDNRAAPVSADVEGHFGGADVGRMDDDFRQRQPALLCVKIGNRKARNADRVSGVIAAGHVDGAGIQRHRRREQLEGRAHLVNALGGAVEAVFAGS